MAERDETLKETLKYLEERCERFLEDGICRWPCSQCRVNIRYKNLLGIDLCEVENWKKFQLSSDAETTGN